MDKIRLFSKLLKSRFAVVAISFSVAFASAFMPPSISNASGGENKDGVMANPLSVEISGVVVPVARDRRLVNYCFMTLIVHAADDRSANLIRTNVFLVKDAIVRGTARFPIQAGNPSNTFNVQAFSRALLPIVQSSVNGARITFVEIKTPEMMRR